MAKGMWIGVGAKARKVKKMYAGVGGKARKVKKVFVGDASGKARLVWQDFAMPSYTGTYVIYGDETKGRIELKTSGTLTLSDGVYDVFCVGGGGAGYGRTSTNQQSAYFCGGGGGAGCSKTSKAAEIQVGAYSVVIGFGGLGNMSQGSTHAAPTSGGSSELSAGAITITADGGNYGRYTGGSGGSGGGGGATDASSNVVGGIGGSNGGNGTQATGATSGSTAAAGSGQGSTTRAFGESANTLYAGGGGAALTAGGGGGGGGGVSSRSTNDASSGTANTGGGGGGTYTYSVRSSGNGGSGLVIVRWGY